jgi:hypothetical protein
MRTCGSSESKATETVLNAVAIYLEHSLLASTPAASLHQRFRIAISSWFRRSFSLNTIESLKSMLRMGSKVQVSADFDIGSVSDLSNIQTPEVFVVDAHLISELMYVDSLVGEFHLHNTQIE